jgi:hypothetical protein
MINVKCPQQWVFHVAALKLPRLFDYSPSLRLTKLRKDTVITVFNKTIVVPAVAC